MGIASGVGGAGRNAEHGKQNGDTKKIKKGKSCLLNTEKERIVSSHNQGT